MKGRESSKTPDVSVGPGSYNEKVQFGCDLKSMTIGTRREEKTDEKNPGPGTYDLSQGELLTKYKSPAVNFSRMKGRAEKVDETSISPASYQDSEALKFGKNLKGITMGERRPIKEKETIGPGVYDVEKADKLTK